MEIKYGRKKSGIKKELKSKINDWINSIDDKDDHDLPDMIRKNVIVTGGAIASMLLGEKVNDFDVYFKTKECAEAVAKYYVQKYNEKNEIKVKEGVIEYKPEVRNEVIKNIKDEEEDRIIIFMKSAGVAFEDQPEYDYFENMPEYESQKFLENALTEKVKEGEKYRPIFMSQNAITLSDKMQVIIRFYGEPDEIHNNYDFAHAMCYWDHAKEDLHLDPFALECLLSRTLIYKGSLYPVASIFRMKKFLERGWRISAGQQLKIMWQISEIDLSDPETIREQLTGVDMAYLYEVIDAIKNENPEKITSSYMGSIIDKIFD